MCVWTNWGGVVNKITPNPIRYPLMCGGCRSLSCSAHGYTWVMMVACLSVITPTLTEHTDKVITVYKTESANTHIYHPMCVYYRSVST